LKSSLETTVSINFHQLYLESQPYSFLQKKIPLPQNKPTSQGRTTFSNPWFSPKFSLVGSDMGLEDAIEGIRSWGPETGSRVGWIGNQWSHPKWGIKVNSPPQPCPTEVISSLKGKQPGDHSSFSISL